MPFTSCSRLVSPAFFGVSLTVALFLPALSTLAAPATAAQTTVSKWGKEVQAFEAFDKTNPPPAHAILFVGSSSIRMWSSLAEDFKGIPVINRGFGGSQLDDCLKLANRLVLPHRPKQILLYAGDNDLAAGKSPEKVFEDYQEFVRVVRAALPKTRIDFIAIKPSPSRWHLAEKVRTANRLISEFAQTDRLLGYIDVFTPMLNSQGLPSEDLFLPDKLHMNRKGYQLWTGVIRPRLLP